MTAMALRVAWRLVGGRAPTRSFFVTHAYFISPLLVVLALFSRLGDGVYKVLAPDSYELVVGALLNRQPIPPEAVADPVVPVVAGLIIVAGVVLTGVWSLVAWGAYRKLCGLGRIRSFLALMIMGVFDSGIAIIVFFVEIAILP